MEIKRLFDFIYYQQEKHPLERAFGSIIDGKPVHYSTQATIDRANQISRGLLQLGVKKGDKIAVIVYKNRPEWVMLDIGIQQIGAINVPVYPTISSKEYSYIFNDAAVTYCFVGTGDLYDKVEAVQAEIPSLRKIFTLDRQENRPFWEEIFSDKDQETVEQLKSSIQEHDLATLIYTSGTTGNPKGVMLSHHNIASNVLMVSDLLPVSPGQKALSFLPLCHIFERTASYSYTYNCMSVTFAGTDDLSGDDGALKRVQPHMFTTVPRLLEKVYEKIINKGLDLKGFPRRLFFWSLKLTEDYEINRKPGFFKSIQLAIADKLIFSKWRAALGGNVRGILTGAAACPVRIMQVFNAAGIPVREGYGLTETSPGVAFGRYTGQGAMLGAVGPALDGVELRIDESDGNYNPGEGEILVKGPNVMMGYYNQPDATAAVMKEIGDEKWFCTGDIGTLITGPDGASFLKITDRKKELLKTSGGKYVAPAPIENKLKEHFLIEQVMVVGEKRKFVSAIIVPAEEALRDWCNHNHISWTSVAEVCRQPKVIAKYQEILDEENPNFSHIEQIKKFCLIPTQWEPTKTDGSEAELTPTLKLKRRVIRKKFQNEIEELYNV